MVYEVADEVELRRLKSSIRMFPGIVALGTLPLVFLAAADKAALQAQLPIVLLFLCLPVAVLIVTWALGKTLDNSVIRVHVSSDGLRMGTLAGNKSIARKHVLSVQSIRSGVLPVYTVATRDGNFRVSGLKDQGGLLLKELRSLTRSSAEPSYESSKFLPYISTFLPVNMLGFLISGTLVQAMHWQDYSLTPVPGLVAWLLLCWFSAYCVCYRVHKQGDFLILSTPLRTIRLRRGDQIKFDPLWNLVACDQGRVFIPSDIRDYDLCEQDLKEFAGVHTGPIDLPAATLALGSKLRPERKYLGWW